MAIKEGVFEEVTSDLNFKEKMTGPQVKAEGVKLDFKGKGAHVQGSEAYCKHHH